MASGHRPFDCWGLTWLNRLNRLNRFHHSLLVSETHILNQQTFPDLVLPEELTSPLNDSCFPSSLGVSHWYIQNADQLLLRVCFAYPLSSTPQISARYELIAELSTRDWVDQLIKLVRFVLNWLAYTRKACQTCWPILTAKDLREANRSTPYLPLLPPDFFYCPHFFRAKKG